MTLLFSADDNSWLMSEEIISLFKSCSPGNKQKINSFLEELGSEEVSGSKEQNSELETLFGKIT